MARKVSINQISPIENTVSFSGADISVIAYGTKNETAGIKTQVEKLRNRLNKMIGELSNKVEEIDVETESINSNANERRLLAGMVEDITSRSGMTPAVSIEGKYQNRTGESKEKANELRSERDGLSEEIERVQKELEELEGALYYELGSIHTLTYSSFREKFAVRSLGQVQAKTYTRGPRTIAGTMVFSVFQEHEFLKMKQAIEDRQEKSHPEAIMLDQLWPFNMMLVFENEYGGKSIMHIFNVDIAAEGQEMSVDNIITHNTLNFYATDILPLKNIGNTFDSYIDMLNNTGNPIGISPVLGMGADAKVRIDDLASVSAYADPNSDEVAAMLAESRGLF